MIVVVVCVSAAVARGVTIDWTTVGDPGNVADTSPAGYGDVVDSFQIMKYEMTNAQYAEFLNAVAATDTHALYAGFMGSDARGGITQAGSSSGTNVGYWDYATQSNTAPTAVTSGSTGTGSAGSAGNFANFNNSAIWNGQTGNVTTVGANGGPSAYGAFDMSGNVREWNDLNGSANINRGLRGGNYSSSATNVSSLNRSENFATDLAVNIGFRLAAPVAVPEPSTAVMAAGGIACGAWRVTRRRKAA